MDVNIVGPLFHAENGAITNSSLTIRSGIIEAFHQVDSKLETLTFPSHYHLVPGFIDMHIHGAQGHDVMDGNVESLNAISKALVAEGTTSFLATTMTADVSQIEIALKNVKNFMEANNKGANIIGVHLEGPFLAASKMGAQNGEKILAPDLELIKRWQKISDNAIKLVTLAPEQPNSEAFIKYLVQQKIIASLGHTNATYEQAKQAISHGCSHATHLFNAMSGVHQREPGVVTAALLSSDVTVELILDGIHLHPAVVALVRKIKDEEKIVLVTDAMRAKCMADGCYDLGGQVVDVKNGEARLTNGTLAGSTLKMSSAIKNMMAYTGCLLDDAIKMASTNPAKVLGIFDRKGSIAIGKDADLVVLDDMLEVVMTMKGGEVVYQKS